MWLSRLVALVVVAALAAFGAGALGLSTYRDGALAETGAGRAAAESRALAVEVSAALVHQRQVAQAALAHADLAVALAALAPDMAPHVRAAVLDPAAQKLSAAHRPYHFVLLDPAGQLAGASGADFAQGWSVDLAEADRLADGKPVKTARGTLWTITLPLPWPAPPVVGRAAEPAPPPPQGRLLVMGPMPADIAAGLFQDSHSPDTLVLLEAAKPLGAHADSPLGKAVTGIFPGKATPVEAAGQTWQAMRTLVPGVHEFYVVVAWPAPAAPTFADLGGPLGILKRIAPNAGPVQVLLGAALLGWLLVVLTGGLYLRGIGQRLRATAADSAHAFPQPASRWPAWLRGAIEALNDAFGDLSRRANERPVHSSVAAPTRPVQALAPSAAVAPAEASEEKSAERSVERSAERSTDALADKPAEKSVERPAEKSVERPAEKSVERPAEKPKAPRPAPPALPTPTPDAPRGPAAKLPALDREENEPETQTDIELRPAAVSGGLLNKLREEKALPTSTRPPGKHENTAIRPVPAELLSAMRDEATRETGVSLAPQAATPEEEAYFEAVWKEFAATKHQCGEPVEPGDFRKFRAKLIRTRTQLMDKFKCRDVRFRVYVKEGKAALKASPVLDEQDAVDAEA